MVPCPSAETLAALVDGRLDEAARGPVVEHLADCARCRDCAVGTVEFSGESDERRRKPKPNNYGDVTPSDYLRNRAVPLSRVEATLRRRLGLRAPDRKTFRRWMRSGGNVKRKDMLRLLWAVRETLSDSTVQLAELFDMDPDSERNWQD